MSGRMTVVIKTCDLYSDLWVPMSDFLRLFWPDCPYEIVLVTETQELPPNTVFNRVIHTNDTRWSVSMLHMLDSLETPYFMLLLEDLWPSRTVITADIERCLDLMESENIGCVQLQPHNFRSDPLAADGNYSSIPYNVPYRVSASPGIWNASFLRSILLPEESPWEFERVGSYRQTSAAMPVLCANQPLFTPVATGAVIAGEWDPVAIDFADKSGVHLSLDRRPIQSKWHKAKRTFKSFVYNLSPRLVLYVQNQQYKKKHTD